VNQNASYHLSLDGLARAPPKAPILSVFVQSFFDKGADFNFWEWLKGEKR
jgi:hypothetical protein